MFLLPTIPTYNEMLLEGIICNFINSINLI